MASVSSLDQDMRNLRMSRYTASAANETRAWIEETLGERLSPGDLLDALKDGVALCKFVCTCNDVNLTIDPLQTRKPCLASSGPTIQAITYAIRADGEYFALSARLRVSSPHDAGA